MATQLLTSACLDRYCSDLWLWPLSGELKTYTSDIDYLFIHSLICMSISSQWQVLRNRNKLVPNHSLISDNVRWRYCIALRCATRMYKCSISTIHFGHGWLYLTGFLIRYLTIFQNKYIPLLFLWWCVWMRIMTNMILLTCKWQKSMHLSFDFFTSQCTGSCIVQMKKSQDACIDFWHLHCIKIIFSH